MRCTHFSDTLRHPSGFEELEPTTLGHQPTHRIIDVREPHEFDGELGHLDGAELVPLATLEQAAQRWDRKTPMLIVCRSGGRSGRAVEALRGLGFACAVNLRGGMLGVRAAEAVRRVS
jgi:rhodanese-related sulfurtransferase